MPVLTCRNRILSPQVTAASAAPGHPGGSIPLRYPSLLQHRDSAGEAVVDVAIAGAEALVPQAIHGSTRNGARARYAVRQINIERGFGLEHEGWEFHRDVVAFLRRRRQELRVSQLGRNVITADGHSDLTIRGTAVRRYRQSECSEPITRGLPAADPARLD